MARNNKAAGATIFALLLLSTMDKKPEQGAFHLRYRTAVFTAYQPPGLSASDEMLVKKHCPLGIPTRTADELLGHSRTIVRDGYVLEYSSELLFPLWVCEHLSKDDLSGPVTTRLKRKRFPNDPALAIWPHSEHDDYLNTAFDRGHMSPDANRTTKQLKEETFYMSNIVPQVGVGFNQHFWKYLECAVREWAQTRDEVWIITGAFLHEPDEESAATANGLVAYATIGAHGVGVPTHLFKIVLAHKIGASAGDWEAVAFVMPNKKYDPGETFNDYLKSIDWIEERSGFDFFPKLSKDKEVELERVPAATVWPIKFPNCGKEKD
jgi:endonuclease G, mitochondrial